MVNTYFNNLSDKMFLQKRLELGRSAVVCICFFVLNFEVSNHRVVDGIGSRGYVGGRTPKLLSGDKPYNI